MKTRKYAGAMLIGLLIVALMSAQSNWAPAAEEKAAGTPQEMYTARAVLITAAAYSTLELAFTSSKIYEAVAIGMELIPREDATSTARAPLARALASRDMAARLSWKAESALPRAIVRPTPSRVLGDSAGPYAVVIEYRDSDPRRAADVLDSICSQLLLVLQEYSALPKFAERSKTLQTSFARNEQRIWKIKHEMADLTEEAGFPGLGRDPDVIEQIWKEKVETLRKYTRRMRDERMNLAAEKARNEVRQERLAREAENVHKVQAEDAIANELQDLVAVAEDAYARTAKLVEEGKLTKKVLQVERKELAEARMAFLRRKEELTNRPADPALIKLKESLVDWEVRLAFSSAHDKEMQRAVEELQNELPVLLNTIQRLEELSDESSRLRRDQHILRQELALVKQVLGELSRVETRIAHGPTLVVEIGN